MHAPAIAGNSVLLLLRLVLGGLFVFAGSLKIADPQAFAFAIKGYDLLDPVGQGGLMAWLAFALPWTEVISGALLVVGARPRAAATVVAGLLAVFTGGYVSVLARGMSVECGCFGSSEFLCSGPIAACHLVRN
ncbi:MAG: MauE/DoxX family redox-associated membrane protein, partial [Planctomycetota bacterium]